MKINRETAFIKAQKYCAYRERCIAETVQKLKDWGLDQKEIDAVIDDLVEQHFINEDRYLLSFVRGKFNNNKWGRIKIGAALRQQQFSDIRIKDVLYKLDPEAYRNTAIHLMTRKLNELVDVESNAKRSKTYYYMLSKGYEADLVMELLKGQ